jgi:hypothetical protein
MSGLQSPEGQPVPIERDNTLDIRPAIVGRQGYTGGSPALKDGPRHSAPGVGGAAGGMGRDEQVQRRHFRSVRDPG